MADTKTSDENPAGPLAGAELLRGVQGGADMRTTAFAVAALADTPIAAAFPVPQGVARLSGNPILAYGSAGQFDAQSMRDTDLFYARGALWMLYTGAVTSTSPYNPTVGLATSTDGGTTWTKVGQIVPANPTSGQWNSGGTFSPCAWYDDVTDELFIFVTGIETPADWYSGAMSIGVLGVAAGADWSNPANYVYLNAGAPILSPSAGWELARVYAPTVKRLNGQFVMLYSSYNNTGPVWSVGRATATSLAGPWTKDAGNPLFHAAEEPSMVSLPGGTLIALFDDLSSVSGPYGIGVYQCSTNDGMGTWSKVGRLLTTGAQTFDAAAIGSSAGVVMPDGTFVVCYNGLPAGAGGNDARKLGVAKGLLQLNVALDVNGVNTLISEALAGGGAADVDERFVQFHMIALPGPRIFDNGPRRRQMTFNGAISNSATNPLFGSVAVRSTAGTGYVSIPQETVNEFNISASEDYTLEIWLSFANAATAIEMIMESDSSGLAVYRTAAGKIEIAKSRIAAVHTGATVIGAGGYSFVVIQRTAGSIAFFIAAAGDSVMTADGSAAADTTAFASSNPCNLMAATGGTANFMNGDIAEIRYSPGVSRGYAAGTAVPTAFLPT